MVVKHIVLPDGQHPTVAFTLPAQLCGPKANETEIGAALFTKMVRTGTCNRRSRFATKAQVRITQGT